MYISVDSPICEAASLGPRIWLAHRAEFAGDLLGLLGGSWEGGTWGYSHGV